MKVTAHPIPEVIESNVGPVADLRAITHDPSNSEQWLSTTTTLFNPNDGLVYLGLTHQGGDILYRFDPGTGKSECLDYKSIRVDREVKVHRSLELAPDGRLFGGSAGLITMKDRESVPGGQIWSFDPETKEYDVYGIPSPGDYIQHITVDFDRMLAYGGTYPVPFFFVYDLKARKTIHQTFIGALPHKTAIDDNGRAWTGYSPSADVSVGEDYLMSYDPDTDKVTFHDAQLPGVGQTDNKQIDDIMNLGDGYIYMGSVSGAFSRLNPDTLEVEWLGKPAPGMRLCGIDEGPDGLIYIATGAFYGQVGDDRNTRLFAFDRKTKQFTNHGIISDPDFGDVCSAVHSLSVGDDGTLWVGETDNGVRSGCLWECRVT